MGIYGDDDILSFYCDKSKIENLRNRTVDPTASKVIIPVIGTDERNNNYHLAMKSALQHHIIRFPVDEMTAKEDMVESGVYNTLTSNQKMRK